MLFIEMEVCMVQVKKPSVEESLLEAATKLFLVEGYEKTTIRRIVKEAGTTLGNFSNYFSNKEAIFDTLVEPAYFGFNEFMYAHDQEDHDESEIDLSKIDLTAIISEIVDHIGFIFTDAFVLLIEASAGTQYEDYRYVVSSYFRKHFLEHLGQGFESAYGDVAGRMFLDGLVSIIKNYQEEEKRNKLVAMHFAFFIYGSFGFIQQEVADDQSK